MGRENQNALLSELEHLSSLRRLEIEVKDSRLAAEQLRLSPNLMQYHIIIGDPKSASWEPINSNLHTYERKLELKWLENTSLGDGYGFNFANVEELRLMSSNSFNNLQQLKLVHLPGLEHLNILSNFNMLSSLSVSRCDQLTSLVTRRSSIVQLKSLEIRCCEMMEQVLLWDEEEDQIVFQNLKLLDLSGLPNVTSFSKGIKSIGFPVLEEMTVGGCGLMKSFVCKTSPDDDDHGDWIGILFKSTKSELDSLRKLWVGGYSGSMCRNWCPMITAIFSRLSELHVCEIRNMKSLFPYSVAQYLHNLIELRIQYCNDMVGVIEDDACGGQTPPTPTPLLPNLKQIILHRLPKLKSVCECKHTLEFPSLTRLYIYDCDSMEEFTWGHVSTPILPHIETGYEGGIINISNGVNATLKQEWLERQQEELNSRSKHPVVEIKEFPMMDQNVDSKRVEQSRKRGLSIGLENEFQSQKSRRIEMEEEHREGSSVQEKMKAPIEIMEEDT